MSPSREHPGYATARDVAFLHRTTIGYVYKLANRDHWRRYTIDGRVRYHRTDVDTTFNGAEDDGASELTQVSGR